MQSKKTKKDKLPCYCFYIFLPRNNMEEPENPKTSRGKLKLTFYLWKHKK